MKNVRKFIEKIVNYLYNVRVLEESRLNNKGG